jgi:multidrug efflux pump subunit AcrB
VSDGIAEKTSYSRLNGQDAVSLGVVKQSGSNTQEVGQQAKPRSIGYLSSIQTSTM